MDAVIFFDAAFVFLLLVLHTITRAGVEFLIAVRKLTVNQLLIYVKTTEVVVQEIACFVNFKAI